MYWSAGGFFGLPTLSTVAFTVTVPALCAGATTVQVFDDVQSTDLAFVAPKLNFVAVVPRANPDQGVERRTRGDRAPLT